ncbi:MAG: hypothetical protein R2784_12755 [Saprospiraceae bacterium]
MIIDTEGGTDIKDGDEEINKSLRLSFIAYCKKAKVVSLYFFQLKWKQD